MIRRPSPLTSLVLCVLAISLSGCIKARLLHPPTSTNVTHTTVPPEGLPGVNGAGGTLKGQGVTLQASFGLATPGDLTGHGVRLRVGN